MHNSSILSGNKYFEWYWNICNRGKDRNLPKNILIEKHHYYPKFIFGKNNLTTRLTPKEHYIVHMLLYHGLKEKYGINNTNTINALKCYNSFINFGSSRNFQTYKECSSVGILPKLKHLSTIVEPKIVDDKIYQYDYLGNLINKYESITDASHASGISTYRIKTCLRGFISKTDKYFWSKGKLKVIIKSYNDSLKRFIEVNNQFYKYIQPDHESRGYKIKVEPTNKDLIIYISRNNIQINSKFYDNLK